MASGPAVIGCGPSWATRLTARAIAGACSTTAAKRCESRSSPTPTRREAAGGCPTPHTMGIASVAADGSPAFELIDLG
jgi:hypothetical protein